MAKRKKKRYVGGIAALVILLVIVAGLFFGRDAIINGIKTKAAKVVAQKVLEDQLAGSGLGDNVDVKKIIDNFDDEDIQTVTSIAEKYLDSESISQYIDMAKEGNLGQIKEQVQQQLSEEDKKELEGLYEKYKDQIGDLDLENITPEDLEKYKDQIGG